MEFGTLSAIGLNPAMRKVFWYNRQEINFVGICEVYSESSCQHWNLPVYYVEPGPVSLDIHRLNSVLAGQTSSKVPCSMVLLICFANPGILYYRAMLKLTQIVF